MSSPKVLSIAVLALSLTAATAPAGGTTACTASGWAEHPAQLRDAPSPQARVVARLAPRAGRGGEITGTLPEFEIVGYQDGWFLVSGASYGDYGDPEPRRPLYAGKGWLTGTSIGGQVFPGGLHAAPDEESRARPYGKETDAVQIRRLLECRDHWFKVETDVGTGWVSGICGNQATTCS